MDNVDVTLPVAATAEDDSLAFVSDTEEVVENQGPSNTKNEEAVAASANEVENSGEGENPLEATTTADGDEKGTTLSEKETEESDEQGQHDDGADRPYSGPPSPPEPSFTAQEDSFDDNDDSNAIGGGDNIDDDDGNAEEEDPLRTVRALCADVLSGDVRGRDLLGALDGLVTEIEWFKHNTREGQELLSLAAQETASPRAEETEEEGDDGDYIDPTLPDGQQQQEDEGEGSHHHDSSGEHKAADVGETAGGDAHVERPVESEHGGDTHLSKTASAAVSPLKTGGSTRLARRKLVSEKVSPLPLSVNDVSKQQKTPDDDAGDEDTDVVAEGTVQTHVQKKRPREIEEEGDSGVDDAEEEEELEKPDQESRRIEKEEEEEVEQDEDDSDKQAAVATTLKSPSDPQTGVASPVPAADAELQIYWDAENISGRPYAFPATVLMSILDKFVEDGVISSNASHCTQVYFVDRENNRYSLSDQDKSQLRDAQCTLIQCTKRKEDADRQIAAAIRRQIDNKHNPTSRPIVIVSSDKDFNSILQDAKRAGLPTYVIHEAPPKSMHENLLKFYAETFNWKDLVKKYHPESYSIKNSSTGGNISRNNSSSNNNNNGGHNNSNTISRSGTGNTSSSSSVNQNKSYNNNTNNTHTTAAAASGGRNNNAAAPPAQRRVVGHSPTTQQSTTGSSRPVAANNNNTGGANNWQRTASNTSNHSHSNNHGSSSSNNASNSLYKPVSAINNPNNHQQSNTSSSSSSGGASGGGGGFGRNNSSNSSPLTGSYRQQQPTSLGTNMNNMGSSSSHQQQHQPQQQQQQRQQQPSSTHYNSSSSSGSAVAAAATSSSSSHSSLNQEDIKWAERFIQFYGLDLSAVFTQEGYVRLKGIHEQLTRRGDQKNRDNLRTAVKYLRSVKYLADRYSVPVVPYTK